MKYKVYNKNQNNVNTMTGDISYEDLLKVEGISTIALKLKSSHSGKKTSSFFKKIYNRCTLFEIQKDDVEYKNYDLCKKYISKRGKVMQSRITGISKTKQKLLAVAIKRLRSIGMIPAVNYGEHSL